MNLTAPSQRNGMVPIEILVIILLCMSTLGIGYSFVRGPSQSPKPTTPQEMAMAAAQQLSRQIRNDIHWARSFKIESKGHRLILIGPEKEKRVYTFLSGKHRISIPSEQDPSQSVDYPDAQFREFLFISRSPEIIKYVIASFPKGKKISRKPNKRERELTFVVSGSACLQAARARSNFPHWNP